MNSKKLYLPIFFFCLLSILFIPVLVNGACGDGTGIVNCGCAPDGSDACTITDIFVMLVKIYNFIILQIATPLAIIALIVGAIMILISAGNANLLGMGKKIIYSAIIGLVLVFCSWLIINFIMEALGYTGPSWSTLPS
jgi:hypothetical protein